MCRPLTMISISIPIQSISPCLIGRGGTRPADLVFDPTFAC